MRLGNSHNNLQVISETKVRILYSSTEAIIIYKRPLLEKVQRRATKLIDSLKYSSYEDILSVQTREYLSEVFKSLTGKEDVTLSKHTHL